MNLALPKPCPECKNDEEKTGLPASERQAEMLTLPTQESEEPDLYAPHFTR